MQVHIWVFLAHKNSASRARGCEFLKERNLLKLRSLDS